MAGLHRPAECVRVHLEIVGAAEITEAGDRSLRVQVVEPLGPAGGAPQVFLVLPSDEAADIEPELGVGPVVKPQREQRDAELGRPSRRVPRDRDAPDAVPALVQVVHPRELRVPHCAVRVRGEYERAAPIVVAVDQDPDVVVAREVGVAAELVGPHGAHVGIIAAHQDVERARVMGHLDDRPLGSGETLARLALAEVVDRVRRAPRQLVEPACGRRRRTHG